MAPTSLFSAGSYVTFLSLASLVFAQNCVLQVPPNPLSAQGLATPYFMSGCNQLDFANQGSFVEAAIFDPATSAVTIYHPLVVNKGDVPGKNFIPPVPATVPAGATVGIWFGTNGMTLTLAGIGARQGNCVNGVGNSVFGQFAACNGAQFMQTALAAVQAGTLTPPPLANAKNGGPCVTTRDFRIVDMDQSDNVVTTYLLINNKVLAQNTPANAGNNTNAQVLSNGSDNALVDVFVDPTTGCTPWMVQSPTAPTGQTAALALNEITANQFQQNPALVPANDPMVVINNNGNIMQNLQKVNAYRAQVGQTPAATLADASGTTYCQQYAASGIYIANNMALFQGATSPAPAVANNLYTFLAQRFAASFGPVPALGCQTIFGLQVNPVNLTMNGNCVVVAATINTNVLQMILNGQIKPVPPAKNNKNNGGNNNAAAAAGTATADPNAPPDPTSVSPAQGTAQAGPFFGKHMGQNNVNPAGIDPLTPNFPMRMRKVRV